MLPPVRPASPSIWPPAPTRGSPASTSARTCWAEADATSSPPAHSTASRSSSVKASVCRSRTRPSTPLTFTYLLRYVADPAATIAELARVRAPRRTVGQPRVRRAPNRFWRAWWWLYTRAVLPVAGGLLGGRAWFDVGRFLGPNITAHYARFPLAAHLAAWEDAGLVRRRAAPHEPRRRSRHVGPTSAPRADAGPSEP